MPKETTTNQRSAEKTGRRRNLFEELERKRALHEIATQKFLVSFACWILGLASITTLAMVCFQGFHFRGFSLESRLMQWIGATTLGVVASLVTIVYRALFRAKK